MNLRKPSYAGSFYPDDPERLAADVDSYISQAGPASGRRVYGVISPHAGYIYSGPAAGYSFRELKNSSAQRVLVLALSHRVPVAGAAVFAGEFYSTPLGDVRVDTAACASLLQNSLFSEDYAAHRAEHSLEVQVPFIQRAMPHACIIPLLIGTVDLAKCAAIADYIYEVLSAADIETAVVVSTDLSHYHPYKEASSMDRKFIDELKKFDAAGLSRLLRSRQAEACGEGPLLTAIPLLKKIGASSIEELCYNNSGDTAGDRSQVVGYLAAAFV